MPHFSAIRLFVMTLCLLWVSGSIASASEPELRKATFLPQWVHQAQFAGFLVGFEKGFYRDHGIDLTILPGGPDQPPSEFLPQGRADFSTMFLSTAIERRSQGLDVVNIGQIVQRSSLMLVARSSKYIYSPVDLNGRKISLWNEFQIQPLALFKKYDLDVEIVPQGVTMNPFLKGGVDVASAMLYNEYHLLLNAGVNENELTTIAFDDYGLNFPEDGIYCMRKTLEKNPELCRDFILASRKGWEYAFAHPEEALDIVMQYVADANLATNRVHQKWMLERMKDIIHPKKNDVPFGTLPKKEYLRVARVLRDFGMISTIPPFKEFFINVSEK
ncbi:MAG: ABC transporter substrate-binding protein [Desulfovibrionales bacterium]